jgi:hypothetical protein
MHILDESKCESCDYYLLLGCLVKKTEEDADRNPENKGVADPRLKV